MSEANRALARRWFEEVWNDRRPETVDELMSPDAVAHMEGAEIRGPAEFHAGRRSLLAAFPDLRVTVEDTVAEGDHVVVRWRVSATHEGAGLGFPASGRPASFRGMTWLRFSGGVVVEGWDAWNQGELLQRLQASDVTA